MCSQRNSSRCNIPTFKVCQYFVHRHFLLQCTISVLHLEFHKAFAFNAYKVMLAKRKKEIFILHLFPFSRALICNHCLTRQLRLHRIRHVDGNPVIAVSRHIVHIDAYHRVVISHTLSIMNRNCTGHFIANLHFLNSCPGCAIRARLVKRFCKRFLPIPAKGKQSGLQCIVQQCIAAAVKVARNFTVLIQFQFGDIPTLYNVSIVQAAFYCFLVCRTCHLMARHPRYKHRLNRRNIHRRIIRPG